MDTPLGWRILLSPVSHLLSFGREVFLLFRLKLQLVQLVSLVALGSVTWLY